MAERLRRATRTATAGLAASIWLTASIASAQQSPPVDEGALTTTGATAPLEAQLSGLAPSPLGAGLMAADLRRIEVEHTQAWTLFAWGTGNVVEGLGFVAPWVASPATASERMTAYGAMTASWGAVNLALSLPWIVRLPSERANARRWTTLSGDALDRELDRARERARADASFFALMCGLDVAYTAVGALLFAMGERPETRSLTLSGFGISLMVQGASLLAFDGWGWAARANDSARFRDSARGESARGAVETAR